MEAQEAVWLIRLFLRAIELFINLKFHDQESK